MIYFIAVLLNAVFGCGIWALVDTDNRIYFNWYKECPLSIIKFLVVSFWPFAIYFFLERKYWCNHSNK